MMSVESMRKVIVCPTRLPMHGSEKDLKTSLHLVKVLLFVCVRGFARVSERERGVTLL